MGWSSSLRSYFKKDISYVLFNVLLALFGVSVILKFFYGPFCGIIPFWIEVIPKVELYLGALSLLVIIGILVTEYAIK